MPDIGLNETQVPVKAAARDPLAGECEHRCRTIDADEIDAGARERQGDAARTAAELQHRTAGVQGQVPPERHITPAECLRILPVVERRVVVPAFVAFH